MPQAGGTPSTRTTGLRHSVPLKCIMTLADNVPSTADVPGPPMGQGLLRSHTCSGPASGSSASEDAGPSGRSDPWPVCYPPHTHNARRCPPSPREDQSPNAPPTPPHPHVPGPTPDGSTTPPLELGPSAEWPFGGPLFKGRRASNGQVAVSAFGSGCACPTAVIAICPICQCSAEPQLEVCSAVHPRGGGGGGGMHASTAAETYSNTKTCRRPPAGVQCTPYDTVQGQRGGGRGQGGGRWQGGEGPKRSPPPPIVKTWRPIVSQSLDTINVL